VDRFNFIMDRVTIITNHTGEWKRVRLRTRNSAARFKPATSSGKEAKGLMQR
jgi:hypothetical protein